MIDGLLLLIGFQFAGELIDHYLHLPIPGPVIGMLLLVVALSLRVPFSQRVEPAANALIANLSLIYFPIGVGLVMEWSRFSAYGWALLVAVVGGTLVAIPLVALICQQLLRGR
jgi:holin-like protein